MTDGSPKGTDDSGSFGPGDGGSGTYTKQQVEFWLKHLEHLSAAAGAVCRQDNGKHTLWQRFSSRMREAGLDAHDLLALHSDFNAAMCELTRRQREHIRVWCEHPDEADAAQIMGLQPESVVRARRRIVKALQEPLSELRELRGGNGETKHVGGD